MYRLLLCDDHDIVLFGISQLLKKLHGFEVAGVAKDGLSAVSLARTLKPDIVIMDVSMPTSNGIDAASEIIANLPDTKIIFLSFHSDTPCVLRALRAGGVAYVLKDKAMEEISEAIAAVVKGRRYFSPLIVDTVIRKLSFGCSESALIDPLSALSRRESQVLQLVAEGKTSRQVAALLNVSVKTVETYRSRLMSKLGINNSAQLVLAAVRAGLMPVDVDA